LRGQEQKGKSIVLTGKPLIIGLLLVCASLATFTVPGEKGLVKVYHLKKELEVLKSQNMHLKKENQALAREANLLTENSAYIEHVIIKEMNLVRPDDIIVEFKRKKQ